MICFRLREATQPCGSIPSRFRRMSPRFPTSVLPALIPRVRYVLPGMHLTDVVFVSQIHPFLVSSTTPLVGIRLVAHLSSALHSLYEPLARKWDVTPIPTLQQLFLDPPGFLQDGARPLCRVCSCSCFRCR